ncbi:hypothetical protein K525DRAFT_367690 [Schizophyllum commune Loenen D]|nr:hypothetical protein K525DRAFT_367690 [Schizophyllum commune Loenen D]
MSQRPSDQGLREQSQDRRRTIAEEAAQAATLLPDLTPDDRQYYAPQLERVRRQFPDPGTVRGVFRGVRQQVAEVLPGSGAARRHESDLQSAEDTIQAIRTLSDEARRAQESSQAGQPPVVPQYQIPAATPRNVLIAEPIVPRAMLESQMQQQQAFTAQAPPGHNLPRRARTSYDSTYGPPPRVSVDVPLGGLPPPPARPAGPSRASTMPGFSGGYGEPSPPPFNPNTSRRHRHTQSAFTGGLPTSTHPNASQTSVARTSSSGGRSHLSGMEDFYAQSTHSSHSHQSGQSPPSVHSHSSHRSTRSDGTHTSSRHSDGSSHASHRSSQRHSGTSGKSSGH